MKHWKDHVILTAFALIKPYTYKAIGNLKELDSSSLRKVVFVMAEGSISLIEDFRNQIERELLAPFIDIKGMEHKFYPSILVINDDNSVLYIRIK